MLILIFDHQLLINSSLSPSVSVGSNLKKFQKEKNSSSVIGFVDIESLLNSLCYKSAFFLLDKKQRISKLYDHKFYILKTVQISSLLTIFLNYNLLKG